MKTKLIHLLRLFLFALFVVGTTAAQEKVQPQKGDGILSLLRRYQREGAEYEQAFIELNKGRLGKNNSLLLDRTYLLPPLQATPEQASKESTAPAASISSQAAERKGNHEPLFGKQLADYRITSSDLKGACFYVVSGHGGPDPGAVGKIGNHTLHEDEYAYDIALRLARCLLMRGATVHIIIQDKEDGIRDDQILQNSKRETCMGSAIPLNQTERLRQRSEKINALYNRDKPQYSRAIFLHIDSRNVGKQLDVYFYHCKSPEAKELAATMRQTFARKYQQHQPERGFTGTIDNRNLYVLNNTTPPALYVELGNMQNSFDRQRIINSNNRQALANWLCDGFAADYRRHISKSL